MATGNITIMDQSVFENSVYRSLMQYSMDGIFAFDGDLCFTLWNPALENLTGIKKEDALSKKIDEVFPVFRKNCGDQIYEQVLNGQRVFIPECRYSQREGYFETQMMPLTNAGNSVMGGVGILNDITDRKISEQYIKQKNEKLERSNTELQQFAYIVSHDLKAPLRAISSLTSWLAQDYKEALGAEGKELVDMIRQRTIRMDDFINAILNYSRAGRQRQDKEKVQLNKLLDEVVDTLRPPKHIKIKVQEALPLVEFEKVKLQQIFQNLIGNAIKYNDKEDASIDISVKEDGRWYKVAVKDNGIGIKEKYFQKIFQLFQTLSQRDETQDTGVGLALVKKIVETNGGKIWVESQCGKGSTFYFTIPKPKREVIFPS